MYDWSLILSGTSSMLVQFQLLLKECTIEALQTSRPWILAQSFSCYWKNVRLKHTVMVSKHTKGKSFSCYWKNVRLKLLTAIVEASTADCFSCYWKNVRLKHHQARQKQKGCSGFSCYWKNVRLKLRNQLIENKRFLTVGFWSVFRKWSICTKSAIIFENLGWLLDCFW